MPESRFHDYKFRFEQSLFAAYGGLMSGRLPQVVGNYEEEVIAYDWRRPVDRDSLISWMTFYQSVIPADFRLRAKIIQAAEDSYRYEVGLPRTMLNAISTHPDLFVPLFVAEMVKFNPVQERLIIRRLTYETNYNLQQLQFGLKPPHQQLWEIVGGMMYSARGKREN